jgi:hypothetical protein
MPVQRQDFAMQRTFQTMPLPLAVLRQTFLEELLRPIEVVVLPFAFGQGNLQKIGRPLLLLQCLFRGRFCISCLGERHCFC